MNTFRLSSGRLLAVGCLCGLVLAPAPRCRGADWPQYRGATHDGLSTDRLSRQWSGTATNPLWRVPLPFGISSFVVSQGRAFTLVKRSVAGTDQEVCVALQAATGAELWAAPLENASYPDGGVGLDDGPRPTPAVSGEAVFVLTSYLHLYRLNAANGTTNWHKDLRSLYGGSVIGWQNAASPVVEGELLFVNANCGSARLLALRVGDGSLAWRAENEAMTHSTPVPAVIQGTPQILFATQSGVVSLDPLSGSRLWKYRYPFTYSTSLAASPVVYDDMVFVGGSQAYSMRSAVVQVRYTNSVWTTNQLWSSNTLTTYWTTPVCHQGFLYGLFGMDANSAFKCVEMRTGAVKWSTNGFGRGGLALANDHLVVLTEKGSLRLVKPNTNAYTEVGRCLAIPFYHSDTNKCWNTPAISDGRIFVHSTATGAAFDFSLPDLKLDPPQPLAAHFLRLTVRTLNGTPLAPSRLAGLELHATTNLGVNPAQWSALTNRPVLLDGAGRLDNVRTDTAPRRFFRIAEPR